MPVASRTNVTCPNCRNQYPAVVEMAIDAQQDPESKLKLLGGRLNTVQCPYCGTPITVASPLVYHDSTKEMLITFVPFELSMPKDQQEKVIGDLIRELTKQLPPGTMKGYVFQPRQALTMQGLIEQILQADGVTPEMMAKQRDRARLIEQFLQSTPETLPALVAQHDGDIDGLLLQTMGLFAQQALQDGQEQAAEQILLIQQAVMQLSTYGKEVIVAAQEQDKVLREVEADVRALGATPSREQFMNLIIGYGEDDIKLQALVGMVRTAFDDRFFEDFTLVIGAAPADSRPTLEQLQARIKELLEIVDMEAQAALNEAVGLLQALIQSPSPDQFIQENLAAFDDAFMAVLSANMQSAEQRGDQQAAAALQQIYQRVMTAMQSNMSPELQFINALITAPSPEDAEQMLRANSANLNPTLLQALDSIEQSLEQRGNDDIAQRVKAVRAMAEKVMG